MISTTHWKIGTRLSLGLGLVIATAVGLAMVGFLRLSGIRGSVEELTSEHLARVEQLSREQNAALVEQSGAAAESQREQASHLANLVRSFKLTHAGGVA